MCLLLFLSFQAVCDVAAAWRAIHVPQRFGVITAHMALSSYRDLYESSINTILVEIQ